MQKRIALSLPEELLEHIFSFIYRDKDRNSVSLVCKSWYEIERWCRRKLIIGNSYGVRPETMIRRFPKVRSVEIKGKPHFDYTLVPVYPWIKAMSSSYTWLEEIRLKRMKVSDECLKLITNSFKNLKVFVLSSCEGFSKDGLLTVSTTCRCGNVVDSHVYVLGKSIDYTFLIRKSESA